MDEERRYRNGRDEVRNAHTPATNAPEAIAKAPANKLAGAFLVHTSNTLSKILNKTCHVAEFIQYLRKIDMQLVPPIASLGHFPRRRKLRFNNQHNASLPQYLRTESP